MRILFVSHYALPHLGGIEVAVDAMARELAGRGHEVTYLASGAVRADEGAVGPAPDGPYRVVRVPAVNLVEDRLGVPYPLFGPRLVRELRRELARADVLHAHGFLYMNAVVALRLARVPSVLTEHVGHVHYDNPLLDRSEALAIATIGRAAARAADALVYFNDKVRRELERLAPGKRLERIENGVDTDRYRPPEPGERDRLRAELGWDERKRVLFVGRLVAKKGLDVALDAARRGGFELVVAGPGRLPGGAPPNVTALGALPPVRVAELYRAADAFLLPSRGEGFPLTVQEAMASGLPVVLSDDPAYRSHLDGAGSGAVLLPPDGAAMARAIEELPPDAGSAAAAHARRAFSWHAAADAHERLYAELLRTSCMAR